MGFEINRTRFYLFKDLAKVVQPFIVGHFKREVGPFPRSFQSFRRGFLNWLRFVEGLFALGSWFFNFFLDVRERLDGFLANPSLGHFVILVEKMDGVLIFGCIEDVSTGVAKLKRNRKISIFLK